MGFDEATLRVLIEARVYGQRRPLTVGERKYADANKTIRRKFLQVVPTKTASVRQGSLAKY